MLAGLGWLAGVSRCLELHTLNCEHGDQTRAEYESRSVASEGVLPRPLYCIVCSSTGEPRPGRGKEVVRGGRVSTSTIHTGALPRVLVLAGAYPHNLECCSAGDGARVATDIYRECDDVMVRCLLTLLCCVV